LHRNSRPRHDSSVSSVSSGDSGHNTPKGPFSSRRGGSSPPGHASGWDDSVHLPDPGLQVHVNGMATPHSANIAKPLPSLPTLTLGGTSTEPPSAESRNDHFGPRRKRSFPTTLPLPPGLKVSLPEIPVITISPSASGSDTRFFSPISGPQSMMSPITPVSATRRSTPPRRWFLPRVIIPSSGGGLLSPEDRPSNSPPPRRKGEIRCLSYNTLDDQAMARLRGKSDHRPIIGTYSISLE